MQHIIKTSVEYAKELQWEYGEDTQQALLDFLDAVREGDFGRFRSTWVAGVIRYLLTGVE